MLRDMAHNYENVVLSLDAPAQRHTQAFSERRTISRKKARVHCLTPSRLRRVWSEEGEGEPKQLKRDHPMVATVARSPMPCSRCVAPQTYHNKLGTFCIHSHAVRDAAAARTRLLPIGAGQQTSRNREETKNYPVYFILCFCLAIFGAASGSPLAHVGARVWVSPAPGSDH